MQVDSKINNDKSELEYNAKTFRRKGDFPYNALPLYFESACRCHDSDIDYLKSSMVRCQVLL